jgi:hypothetical protein
MPSVQVLYFARAREATGGLTEETFALDPAAADTEHLKTALVARHCPKPLIPLRVALDPFEPKRFNTPIP